MHKNYVRKLLREAWSDIWSRPLSATLFYLTSFRFVIRSQLLPLITAMVIDAAANGTIATEWKRLLVYVVIGEIGMYAMGYTARYVAHTIQEYTSNIRYARVIREVLSLHYQTISNVPSGDLASKAKRKAEFINHFNTFSIEIPKLAINTVLGFFILLPKSASIAWAFLLVRLPIAYIFYKVANRRVAVNKVANAAYDEYMGIHSDIIHNADTVKLFGREQLESKGIEKIGRGLWHAYAERWKIARGQANVMFGIETLLQVVFAVYGLYSLARGQITIGTFSLVVSYIGTLMQDLNMVSHIIRNFSEETTAAIALDEMSEQQPALPEPKTPAIPKRKTGEIDLSEVSFSYSNTSDATIESLSLHIPNAQRVGIVGRSGSGKTTLTRLLLRLHAVQSGEIRISGENIDLLGSEQVRNLISYVPQDPILFHRSIRENILYGNEQASEKAIQKASKDAYVDEFAKSLPKKLDTLVGNRGIKLSGGQRQRVALARAMIKKSPILLLDEATSALDSESESIIQQALMNAMEGRTTIVIAHRLSTLKYMDRIIVMDKGAIVEDGTHDELIGRKGLYAKLWSHQSNGFIED